MGRIALRSRGRRRGRRAFGLHRFNGQTASALFGQFYSLPNISRLHSTGIGSRKKIIAHRVWPGNQPAYQRSMRLQVKFNRFRLSPCRHAEAGVFTGQMQIWQAQGGHLFRLQPNVLYQYVQRFVKDLFF